MTVVDESCLEQIRRWAKELGFSQIGVSGVDLSSAEPGLLAWLEQGFHGSMAYMERHGLKRARPAELVPGTVSVISLRMDYLPAARPEGWQAVRWEALRGREPMVSLYAHGRDYHKVMRGRLQTLGERVAKHLAPMGFRAFTDSAPVLEVELASRSGLGWRGRHSLALSRDAGSMFFLGELFVDLTLPTTPPVESHCGTCTACVDACPTAAIVADGVVDARRCISYLTIEHDGAIPLEFRSSLGMRIYGCDDCQLVCPWNKYAQAAMLPDFDARQPWVAPDLLAWWRWTEADFLKLTEGSAIRRIGFERWQRNLAVVSGNALARHDWPELRLALMDAMPLTSELVQEHVQWALSQGSTSTHDA